jgi:hypothetical protein
VALHRGARPTTSLPDIAFSTARCSAIAAVHNAGVS